MNEHTIEVLLVEDNPNEVELTLHALKKFNIINNIFVVRDGAEALDYVYCQGDFKDRNIHKTPKLILLDLKLPKIDGIEVLRNLKGNESTRTIPVVILTSSREEKDIVESYQLGVNSYIVKPVDFNQFAEAVRQIGYYWMMLNMPPSSL